MSKLQEIDPTAARGRGTIPQATPPKHEPLIPPATSPAPAAPVHVESRVPALDAVRGLAILAVMLYQFNIGPPDSSLVGRYLFKVFRLGGSGVDLFFVLSGFLITGVLLGAKTDPHYFRTFYVRRALRIFPLYYGALFVAFVVLPWFHIEDRDVSAHQAWLWLYGTNFYQAWMNSYALGRFNHFWSLAIEEHFYFVWPLVIYLCSRTSAMRICLACVAMAFACRLALVMIGDYSVACYVLTPCRMDALAMGALIALAARGPAGTARLLPALLGTALIAVASLVYLFFAKGDLPVMDGTVMAVRSTLSACVFGALLLVALKTSSGTLLNRFWNSKVLRFFGKYSYGIYVFHFALLPSFVDWFGADGLAERLHSAFFGRLAFMALAITISTLLAVLSWHAFEKRFLAMKDVLAPRS